MQKLARLFIFLLTLNSVLINCKAQASDGIYGTIVEKDNSIQTVPFATIKAYKNGVLKGEAKSDFNGEFILKPLPQGVYSIEIKSVGFIKKTIPVSVKENNRTELDMTLQKKMRGRNGYIFCNECGEKSRARFYTVNDTTRVSSHLKHDCIAKKKNVSMGRIINSDGHGLKARIDFYNKKELIRTIRTNDRGFFHVENKKKTKLKINIFSSDYKTKQFKSTIKKGEQLTITLKKKPIPK